MQDNIFASAAVEWCACVRVMQSLSHANRVALPHNQIYRYIYVFESIYPTAYVSLIQS